MKNYKWLLAPEFEQLGYGYAQGLLAAAGSGGLWGYLDFEGRWAIPPQFYVAGAFCEDLAVVAVRDQDGWVKRGYIDRCGEFVIPPQLSQAGAFSQGLAVVRKNYDTPDIVIDRSGEQVFGTEAFDAIEGFCNGRAMVRQKGRYGYISRQGELVIKPSFVDAASFAEGLAAVTQGYNSPSGYIDLDGEWAIRPQFTLTEAFQEGLAIVTGAGWSEPKPQTGDRFFINRQGEPAFTGFPPFSGYFNNGRPFSQGLAAICHHRINRKNGLQFKTYGFIDRQGAWHLRPRFRRAGSFHEGYAWAMAKGGYDFVPGKEEEGVHLLGLYGYLDRQGKWLVRPQFDEVRDVRQDRAVVRKGKHWGLIALRPAQNSP